MTNMLDNRLKDNILSLLDYPAWQPVSTSILASAINVRSEPVGNSPVIGTVSGDVVVIARDESGEAVYLAEPAG